MRPAHLVPVVALTFGLMLLAPLARGDGQPETKQPKALPKELPKAPPLGGADAKLPPAVKLPVTRVVLFNAGIAYFHREGDVTGEGRLDLRFDEADVNDLLKSLVLTDKDGGKVRAVTYDNRVPLDFTLKGFAVDVTENPTMGQLMHQVRGEKVEISDKLGTTTTGQIVSVERPPAPAMGPDPGEILNLLTEDGLQTVELKQAKKIKFLRAELQAEFKKALELLATARGDNKKAVSVVFTGQGKRKVAVGYVMEAPLWKPSYRLSVDDKGATRLQGWATVENTTDEDWVNVKVGLVAGRPMTFQMDMYDPLFVPRPTVEPELFASLRPPMYQGGLNPGGNIGLAMGNFGGGLQNIGGNFGNPFNNGGGNQGFGGGFGGNPLNNGGGQGNQGFQGGFTGVGGGNLGQFGMGQGNQGFQGGFTGVGGGNLGGQFGIQGGFNGNPGAYPPRVPRPSLRDLHGERLTYADYLNRLRGKTVAADEDKPKPQTVKDPLDKEGGALAVADGALGDMFEYTIEEPITLAKQKSALVPLVNEAVEGSRVSIFNASNLEKHPLLGLRLANKTKLHLAQGPVAVYDGGTFAGDARLPDIKPGETRLVSYAIDLGTEVVSRSNERRSTLLAVTVSDDKVLLRSTIQRKTTYLVRNRNTVDRTVVIEHPLSDDWKLVTPAKPDDRTRSFYRFDVQVKTGGLATLEVTEESVGTESYSLASAKDGLLGSEVVVRSEDKKPTLLGITTSGDKVTLRSAIQRTTTYVLRNRNTTDRTIVVEHPQTSAWKLVAPDKHDERVKGFYRFEVPVKAGAVATLEVTEESTTSEAHSRVAAREGLMDAEVIVKSEDRKPQLLGITVADGKVSLKLAQPHVTTYTVRNRGTADRTISVEHPLTSGWKLVSPDKRDEQTKGFYRFDLAVKAGAVATLEVTEESTSADVYSLANTSREVLLSYVNAKEAKPAVRDLFKKLIEMREKVDDVQKSINELQETLKEIAEDQDRIRKNIEKAPKESDAFKRYLKKFDEQETVIEKHQARVKELKAELAKHEKALREFAESAKTE